MIQVIHVTIWMRAERRKLLAMLPIPDFFIRISSTSVWENMICLRKNPTCRSLFTLWHSILLQICCTQHHLFQTICWVRLTTVRGILVQYHWHHLQGHTFGMSSFTIFSQLEWRSRWIKWLSFHLMWHWQSLFMVS